MSNDVPTKPGYYRDFEGDIWRLEEEGVNNWTLRPGQPTEERNVEDFWRYQPMYDIPTPAGLPEVEYRVEVSEHGFTVGQRLYTTNSQWPEIDFVGESTFNGKPYVNGVHSEWGVAGHFHLSEVSATAPLADWEKELLEGPEEGQESEPPFAREGVIYRSRSTGMDYKIRGGKLYFGTRWDINSHDYVLKDVTPDNFEIVAEQDAEVAEELPPVSRKHFDESKAAGERRRQKLITHVEELQAKLSEKNKVIAQREATLRSIRNLVV